MKPHRIVFAFLATLALAACATTGERASGQARASEKKVDYVSTVESTARRRGIYLQWVNPPSRTTVRRGK